MVNMIVKLVIVVGLGRAWHAGSSLTPRLPQNLKPRKEYIIVYCSIPQLAHTDLLDEWLGFFSIIRTLFLLDFPNC